MIGQSCIIHASLGYVECLCGIVVYGGSISTDIIYAQYGTSHIPHHFRIPV